MSTLLRRQFTALLLIVTLFVAMIGVAKAAPTSPSNIVSYQGRMLNSAGIPVSDSSLSIKFKLYDDPTAGTCLWSNSSSTCASAIARSVSLTSGLFSENLGDTGASYAAIPTTVFSDHAAVYLGITVGSDTEMTPRKRLTAAPYALNAQTLDGLDSTDFISASGPFNGISQLVQLDGTGKLPAIDGSQLTGISSGASWGSITGTLSAQTDLDSALSGKEATISAGTTGQYYRGDKSWQTLDKTAVGLGSVENTALSTWAGSSNITTIGSLTSLNVHALGVLTSTVASISSAFDTSTDGVHALDLQLGARANNDHVINITPSFVDTATGGLDFSVMNIAAFGANAGAAGDTVQGLSIGTLTQTNGENIDASAIKIGSGWDRDISFLNMLGSSISFNSSLVFYDGSGNGMLTINDMGTTGELFENGDIRSLGTIKASAFDTEGAGTLTMGKSGATAIYIGENQLTPKSDAIYIATENTGADTIVIGNNNASTTVSLSGGDDWSILSNGVITATDFSCSDCLDFTELADSMVLDAATSITGSAGKTFTLYRTAAPASVESAMHIDFFAGAGDTNDEYTGLMIDVTATPNTGSNNIVQGLRIGSLLGTNTNGRSDALSFGSGWDNDIVFNGTDHTILLNGTTLTVKNGASDPLMTLTNTGSEGQLSISQIVTTGATDITTGTDQNLVLEPNGTGVLRLNVDSNSNVLIYNGINPGPQDMLAINNITTPNTTDDAAGLHAIYSSNGANASGIRIQGGYTGGVTDLITYNALQIDGLTASNAAGTDYIHGITIGDLIETDPGNIDSSALTIGSGWDNAIEFESAPKLTVANGGTFYFSDGTNTLMSLADSGTSGTLTVSKLVTSNGITGTVTTLDGSTTAVGPETDSTDLTVVDETNFDIGNYVVVDGVSYAKIIDVDAGVITVSPALTWNNGDSVVEVYMPEIGGLDEATPANETRYGRGYFIDGIVTGNGTTYYSENGISTTSSAPFNFANAATVMNLGSTDIAHQINIGTGIASDTINIGTGGTGVDLISIGSSANEWNIDSGGIATFLQLITTGTTDITSPTGENISLIPGGPATNLSAGNDVTIAAGKAGEFGGVGGNLYLVGGEEGDNGSAQGGSVYIDTGAIHGGDHGSILVGSNSPVQEFGVTSTLFTVGSLHLNINSNGDLTTALSTGDLLDGNTTANGAGTSSTSLILTSATNFDIGNYVRVGSGPYTYAKITNIVGDTLTISPALSWSNGAVVWETHIPEIGSTNTASDALETRYGRGYFIDGIVTGNGTTYYSENGITTTSTAAISLFNTNTTSLSLGGAATSLNIGDSTTSKSIHIGGVNSSAADAISIATNGTSADAIYIGNNNGSTITYIYGGTLDLNSVSGTKTTNIGGSGGNDGVDTINIATNGTSADVITIGNTNSSTSVELDAGGVVGGLYLGVAGSTHKIYMGGSNGYDAADTIQISTDGTTADSITIGNTNTGTISRLTGRYLYLNNVTGTNETDIGGNGSNSATDTINIATNGTLQDVVTIGNTNSNTQVELDAHYLDLNDNSNSATIIDIGGVNNDGGNTVSIATEGTTADTITIGNSNASTLMSLTGGDDWSISTAGVAGFKTTTLTQAAVGTSPLTITGIASGTVPQLAINSLNISGDAMKVAYPSSVTPTAAGTLNGLNIDLRTNVTINNSTVNGVSVSFPDNMTFNGSDKVIGFSLETPGTITTTSSTFNSWNGASIKLPALTDSGGVNFVASNYSAVIPSASLTSGIYKGLNISSIGTESGTGTIYGIDIGATSGGTGTTTVGLNIGTGWDNQITGNVFKVDGSGNVTPNLVVASGANGPYALCHENNGAQTTDTIKDCNGAPTADYAEQYPTVIGSAIGDILVPGTKVVVTNNGDHIVQLIKSSTPYTGPVVGIISDNTSDFTSAGYNVPESENPQSVALVGRVPVNVTNENGPIHVGDFITTSSTPGKGMKATLAGRIIGMALSDFDGLSGQVMVQVNNSWYFGSLIGNDGTSTLLTDNVIVAPVGKATASTQTFDSYGLALRGSAWDGNQAQPVSMMMKNVITDGSNYRLSVKNTAESEIAYITNTGTMQVAGDMVVGGKIYPSNLGGIQKDKYIYYDGSAGPGGDFMRTNASGWSTGSYDFAEMFPSTETLHSGDVVVFSDTNINVKRSSKINEKSIAGIVSTRPGFLAGENTPGSFPIALAGRVPTNVNTENGDIAVGDPLTTSSVAGFAMKATKAGPIVGYALEPLTAAQGQITVFVSAGYWGGDATSQTPGADNRASAFGSSSGGSMMTSLSMSGSINMNGNEISNIGRMIGLTNAWRIEMDGTIKTESLLKTVITGHNNEKVETSAVTSPEVMITLSGSSTLVDGQAEVRFFDVNKDFGNVISAEAPIRVVATPNGPVSLYVSEKDNNHFIVKSFGGSGSDIEFDWVVTGYRKGFEPVVAPVAQDTSATAPSTLTVSTTNAIAPTLDAPVVADITASQIGSVSVTDSSASSTSSSTTFNDSSVTNVSASNAPTSSP